MARNVSAAPRAKQFVEHLRDVFRRIGPLDVRRMFGAYAVCHQALTFAIVVAEVLYLKAGALSPPSPLIPAESCRVWRSQS